MSQHHLEHLSPRSLSYLTQLLSIPPSESLTSSLFQVTQVTLLSTFPRRLLRPTSLLPRISLHFKSKAKKAVLCWIHKSLDPLLVRRVFLQVSAECSVRIGRLVERVREEGEVEEDIREWVKRVGGVNGLWVSQEILSSQDALLSSRTNRGSVSGRRLAERGKRKGLELVESRCEACILCRVGGDSRILTDLRIAILSQRRRSRYPPRLLALVNAWIGWTGLDEEIRKESDEMAPRVWALRTTMQQERRRKRRELEDARKSRIKRELEASLIRPSDPTQEDEAGEDLGEVVAEDDAGAEEAYADFENSIISYYRNLVSSQSLNRPETAAGINESHIHPAFRESIVFDEPSGTFHGRKETLDGAFDDSDPPKTRQTFYTQSVYSRDSGFESARNLPAEDLRAQEERERRKVKGDKEMAEHRAEAYRKLVGIPELSGVDDGGNDEDERKGFNDIRKLMRPETSASSYMTKWSDLYNGRLD